MKYYWQLLRLDKPIGILLLLWPTLWGLWLASAGQPDMMILGIFIMGVVLMRSAGCVMNDIADRHVDGFVKRTKERPLVAGKVSVKAALLLAALLSGIAFASVFFINFLTVKLALIGAALTLVYPYLKRVTHLPQVGLGLAFAWGVPMAFAALQNRVPGIAWELFVAAAIWPVIYDTMYAMVDKADDVLVGVKSTAILFSRYDKLVIAVLQLLFLCILIHIGYVYQLHVIYFLSLLGAAMLFSYQRFLIKDRIRENCFRAFLNNHWVGMVIFFGIGASYLW